MSIKSRDVRCNTYRILQRIINGCCGDFDSQLAIIYWHRFHVAPAQFLTIRRITRRLIEYYCLGTNQLLPLMPIQLMNVIPMNHQTGKSSFDYKLVVTFLVPINWWTTI